MERVAAELKQEIEAELDKRPRRFVPKTKAA